MKIHSRTATKKHFLLVRLARPRHPFHVFVKIHFFPESPRFRFSRGDYEFAFRSASTVVFEQKSEEAAKEPTR